MSKMSWLGGMVTGSLLTAAGLALAGQMGQGPLNPNRLFSETLAQISQYYVDPVDEDRLADTALKGLVSSLDDYSKYLEGDDIRELQEMADGHYSGLGLEVDFDAQKHLIVTSPIKDSPAAKAGIKAGDRVLAINGQDVEGKSLKALAHELRGAPQDKVKLLVSRNSHQLRFAIAPADVQVDSVTSYPLDHHRLWLRISQFQYSTPLEVSQAIKSARPQSVIIDMRGNPGGVFPAAVDVADLFLSKGTIVSTHGRASYANQSFEAKPGDPFETLPLLVLLDKDSASAAEILAGALKDNGRAKVLGVQSFGKGSVQSLIPLGDGERALKITTAKYLTPSGVSIQGKGITPDIKAGTILADAKARSLLKSHYPLTRKAETTVEGNWADDALLWEATSYLDNNHLK
ncbi:MAG: S41 family peptidase [Pseudomonadota bacterium]|uniref:Carboxyl-terminal processing protease n=1 Tax=Gallaecimonas pentaromativorans TaxID=584787 RepID=A0A3N1PBS7_9GAMM|nr:S41 family peptidase [Gallaecimonas pentaromativorans]MED5526741.1 S41 family peptidase [Pseudomonadota bacterium]ROQ24290.1 carboxyl-terminal processing protease [Gallaecimonas pentaromativorans]